MCPSTFSSFLIAATSTHFITETTSKMSSFDEEKSGPATRVQAADSHDGTVDKALALLEGSSEFTADPVKMRQLLWRIDRRLMPVMML